MGGEEINQRTDTHIYVTHRKKYNSDEGLGLGGLQWRRAIGGKKREIFVVLSPINIF